MKIGFHLQLYMLSIGCMGFSSAHAAPLDAFLSANTHRLANESRFEVAYDAVNETLDVLKIRANDPIYGGTSVGDYNGLHMHAGYGVTGDLWLEGGVWRRQILYRSDTEKVDSAQLAVQYRFLGTQDTRSSYGLRMSLWTDSASILDKNTPTQFQGQTADSISVVRPRDRQVQIDLVGNWKLSNQTRMSAFVGAGNSRVQVDNVSATANRGGCLYALSFVQTTVVGNLTAPCQTGSGTLLQSSFSIPTTLNVMEQLSYTASYVQTGGMLQWSNPQWQLRGGYQYQKLRRNLIDDQIAAQGGTSHTTNHILIGDVSRKIASNVALFVRGQYMSNQFVGEVPFLYNSFTASRFDRRYGLVSFGVRFGF